jgi:uncharacterized protein (UPF0333 family)
MEVQGLRRVQLLAHSERGQTTAEYSLVLLVAGLVVGVFAAFVKSGELQHMFHIIITGLVQHAQG